MTLAPEGRLVRAAGAVFAASIAHAAFGSPVSAGGVDGVAALMGALVAVALVDLALPRWRQPVRAEREAPGTVAVGVPFATTLEVTNDGPSPRSFEVFDGLPEHVTSDDYPATLDLPARGGVRHPAELRAERRGELAFRDLHVRLRSPLGLWSVRRRLDLGGELKVLPNYRPVVKYSLLAVAHRQEQSGIRRRPRRGQGTSFHQLRDYREGDLPQQIDWKATARRRELISREYEEERDQRVVLLLDRSRRMSVRAGETSLLDHALNASLLLSYVALEQGDRVSALGFSGEPDWIPPVRGRTGMKSILFGTYDWETSGAPSDFFDAAKRTLVLERRRALVVMMTSLQGEDAAELQRAVESLSRRHLVVVANLRDPAVDEALARPARGREDTLAALGAAHHTEALRASVARLRERGMRVIDVTPEELPTHLATAYLDAKQSGAL